MKVLPFIRIFYHRFLSDTLYNYMVENSRLAMCQIVIGAGRDFYRKWENSLARNTKKRYTIGMLCTITPQEEIAMIEATSCGGVVIFRGKILLLYKNYKNKYEGWVLPKGTVEEGEEYKETAAREVLEETGVRASIIKYVGMSQYTFSVPEDTVEKEVHWYLMMADSYYSKPQREEYFTDSGYYKFHEAYHLLKFSNEKQILDKAYGEYLEIKRNNLWGSHKYF